MIHIVILFPVCVIIGVFGIDIDSVSVKEGDTVSLYTHTNTVEQEKIKWFYEHIRIAQINGDLSFICTDVHCEDGDERFTDKLKLDNQTGSLTIKDIRNAYNGDYHLQIIGFRSNSDQVFRITVQDASATEPNETRRKSVKEGESVTLDTIENINPYDVIITWYFNGTIIAQKIGDRICEDVKCDESFRNRLKVNESSGSLTITNIRITDSGEYKLEINSSSFSIHRYHNINVIREESLSVTEDPNYRRSQQRSSSSRDQHF